MAEQDHNTFDKLDCIAIGIDLGTTYSCVAVWKNGQIEIIPNSLGDRTTPSYVAFTDVETIIGSAAKNQCVRNVKNTVFDIKRLIGREYNRKSVQKDIKNFPFKVQDNDGNVEIQVNYLNELKTYRPEQISAFILDEMKKTAESYLGHKVHKAVITVPAYFNNSQRLSTKNAGEIAGLEVLRIINEPTAAAVAYGYGSISSNPFNKEGKHQSQEFKNSNSDNDESNDQIILVIDIGGGTTDLSLLNIDGTVIEVISTSGDTHYGGSDFDILLVEYCVKKFKQTNSHLFSSNSDSNILPIKAIRRLRTECEKVKKILSSSNHASIDIDSLYKGEDFTLTISRAKFNDLCFKEFKRLIPLLNKVLSDSKGISKSDVDEIILVGGSTRIPKIRELIREFFNGKSLNLQLHPDEAIAYGAAVKAHDLVKSTSEEDDETLLLLDVIPLSLGLETAGGIMTVLLERNMAKPAKEVQIFTTNEDNQPAVTIQIYEGERSETKYNHLLGKFNFDIPPVPRGVPQIEVTFSIDVNGILNITAYDKITNAKKTTSIENSQYLSTESINDMILESNKMKEYDLNRKQLIEIRGSLENLIYQLKQSVFTLSSQQSANFSESEFSNSESESSSLEDKNALNEIINNTEEWLDNHNVNNTEMDEFLEKKHETEGFANPVMTRLYNAKSESKNQSDQPDVEDSLN